jgi:ribose transport system ATP-binding protein
LKLLKLENVSKNKDNTLMLDQINFEIKKGEICGIISDNQDKLNLLINIIAGIEKEDSGHIYYKSKELSTAERIRNVGIARGNYKLLENLNVLENIFFGNFHRYSRLGFFINKKVMRRKADEILKKLQVSFALKNKLSNMNRNERLLIEIARVLAMDTDFNIFGYVTRSLSLRKFEALTSIIKEMKNKGKCVILLPGTAEDIKMLVDRLYFLKGSQIVEIESFNDLSTDKLNELLLSSEKLQTLQVYDPIYKAKQLINEHINENDLDYQKIAQSVYMGYENFRRRFKNEVGLSPNQYFIKVKMEKAKEMLLYTHLEIKEIADKLGFSDPYYFSRIFKIKEKLSPAKFRENEKSLP